MSKVDILGVGIDDIDTAGLERAIVNCVRKGKREIFAYANIHAMNIAGKDKKFREFLNEADIVYCDGEGIRMGARILGMPLPPRTVLTRWIWDLGALFQEQGISAFLLGGRPRSMVAASTRWRERYSGLKLVGYHHGYFDRSGRENDDVVALINRARPNVLFVGFGMPEQELWIGQNLGHLDVNAVLPCGGMIDYLSGDSASAPRWMTVFGLEWFHRLAQDPARLWRRYLLGNPVFMFNILREFLTRGRTR